MKEVILGQVVSKANHYMVVPSKNGDKHLIKDNTIKAYEKSFKTQCKVYRNKHIRRPFHLLVDVYMASWSYDLDNALKTVLDCLQYCGAVDNDNKCVCIVATKHIDRKNPRIEFEILETEPTLF